MRKDHLAFLVLAAALPVCALGQSSATYVSALGSDANACTATAPCRSFNVAANVTAANGVIVALTGGNYAPITVTKSLTIDGGGMASIVVPANNEGVYISAGATDSIVVRGLSIIGATNTSYGIYVSNAGSVLVQNTTITNTVDGVVSTPSGALSLSVDMVTAFGNGTGLYVRGYSQGSPTKLVATNSNFSNSTDAGSGGVLVDYYVNATFKNTTASNNQGIGFEFQGSNQGALFECVATANAGAAVVARSSSGTSVVRLGGNRFTANGNAITVGTNGLVGTYGDNDMSGQIVGTLTQLGRQ